jgi:DNA-binding helix-hairpin-helix protein with protein kinase domain
MIYKGKGGLHYTLASSSFKSGGEAEIYDIIGQPDLVAKIYKPGKSSVEKERKLVKMVDFPPDSSVLSQIAWPKDVLYDAGSFVGFVMPKMKIYEDLNVIYEYGSSAKYHDMSWENRIIIAENLCAVLNSVHAVGHVCGDFNPKNISVDPDTGHIVFLDTDSYHIQDGVNTYRCEVGMPEYLPFEIRDKTRKGVTLARAVLPTFSQATDNFALAIHIFQLLMNG